MERYLSHIIHKDLTQKMVLLTGPRQVGKTYLSRKLMDQFKKPVYLNYDNPEHSRIIQKSSWPLEADYLILDEIHKMKDWKSSLKGIYDTKADELRLLVTGSARMETYRQSGDSLAGRYFSHRLHPLSVGELKGQMPPDEALNQILELGAFPEPFLSGSKRQAGRWRNQYFTDLIREDIMDFSRLNEIRSIRLLVELLRERVGSPLSLNSLAGDLQISPHTVKKYLEILESLYIIFLIRPYHRNIARSLLKEPKVYFFDTAYIKGDEGVKLENTVACGLLKNCHYEYDVNGNRMGLYYLRTKDKKEVDFLISRDDVAEEMIEVKLSNKSHSPSLRYFKERYPDIKAVQLVKNLALEEYDRERDIHLNRASDYLARLA
ncbi:MAG: ATP-binding protein [Spirochaetales bacterium]|nr:ATP-binding protein [Spirochaetales bacterium]